MAVRSIEMIMVIANALEELVEEVVFVGGCATPLLVEEAAQPEARMTEDVDFVIEAAVTQDYYRFAEKIREKGFREDMQGAIDGVGPLCRWTLDSGGGKLVVDVMPTEADVLGFANPWYPAAFEAADRVALPNQTDIRVVAPLYFLATKFNAWQQRGHNDVAHKDIEDIVFVLEYGPRLAVEFMDELNTELKDYLKESSNYLLNLAAFANLLPGMVTEDKGAARVLNTLRLMAR